VIEAYRELRGSCINWGKLATKTLRESALLLSGFRAAISAKACMFNSNPISG